MKSLRNERGWAMPLALMVTLVVSLLGTALWQYAMAGVRIENKTEKMLQAHYLARSGVSAGVDAWLDMNVDSKPAVDTEAADVYLNSQMGNYQTNLPQNAIGKFHVLIDKDHDDKPGEWSVESMGTVDGVDQMVTGTTQFVFGHEIDLEDDGDPPDWYDEETGEIQRGPNHSVESGYDVWTHDPVSGTVILKTAADDTPLDLQNGDIVAFSAYSLFFQSNLDVTQEDVGALVVSGENIIFNEEISTTDGWFDYGTLVLHLPDDLGYFGSEIMSHVKQEDRDDVDEDAVYGRVYFQRVFEGGNQITALSQKAFYFKQKEDGLDILDYEDGDFLQMTDNDAGPPLPRDCTPFIYQ